jgi:outer membrane protein OmpA-like peptidoglycan-associated protein
MMVTSLKRYPKSMASVEAYIEDTGDADENLLLSENRAMLVREELIGRGIEPSRVKAEGRGPRQTGNQIYFVINGL